MNREFAVKPVKRRSGWESKQCYTPKSLCFKKLSTRRHDEDLWVAERCVCVCVCACGASSLKRFWISVLWVTTTNIPDCVKWNVSATSQTVARGRTSTTCLRTFQQLLQPFLFAISTCQSLENVFNELNVSRLRMLIGQLIWAFKMGIYVFTFSCKTNVCHKFYVFVFSNV